MKDWKKSYSARNDAHIMLLALLFLLAAFLLNLCLGASGLSLSELIRVLGSGPNTTAAGRIVWYVRLPRIAAGMLAGAGLSVSGVIIQKVLANPLASPGIIGINAGASLAVTICCAVGNYYAWMIAGSAFSGAVISTFLVVLASQKSGASRTTVLLGGIAVSASLTAVREAIVTMIPNAGVASTDFRMGGFSSVDQSRLLPAAILILAGIILAVMFANDLEILSLGDDTAHSLGVRTVFTRNLFLTAAALLAGASVSFAGCLSFVGLIVPNLTKLITGGESTKHIVFSALFGAAFVSVCDLAARMIFAPYEMPAGIFISMIGGPFFIWLLFKRKDKKRW